MTEVRDDLSVKIFADGADLDVILALAADKRIAGFTTNPTLMAKAGLTVGGFYAHFASKDDLIAAAIDEMFAEAKSRLLLETGDRPPAEAVSAYIDFYLSQTHRDARATGCPMPSLAADRPAGPLS